MITDLISKQEIRNLPKNRKTENRNLPDKRLIVLGCMPYGKYSSHVTTALSKTQNKDIFNGLYRKQKIEIFNLQ